MPNELVQSGEEVFILTAEQQTRQDQLCQIVDDAILSLVSAGKALETIRDERLYEEETFEEFVKERFGVEKKWAHRKIEAAGIADELQANGLPIPRSESHYTELSKFKEEELRVQIWHRVVQESPVMIDGETPMVSASQIKKIANEVIKPSGASARNITEDAKENIAKARVVVTTHEQERLGELHPTHQAVATERLKTDDKTLDEIIEDVEETVAEDAPEIEELMRQHNTAVESWVRAVRKEYDKMVQSPWIDQSTRQMLLSQLNAVFATMRLHKAHDRCTECGGTGCDSCRQTGWMTENVYNQFGGMR